MFEGRFSLDVTKNGRRNRDLWSTAGELWNSGAADEFDIGQCIWYLTVLPSALITGLSRSFKGNRSCVHFKVKHWPNNFNQPTYLSPPQ